MTGKPRLAWGVLGVLTIWAALFFGAWRLLSLRENSMQMYAAPAYPLPHPTLTSSPRPLCTAVPVDQPSQLPMQVSESTSYPSFDLSPTPAPLDPSLDTLCERYIGQIVVRVMMRPCGLDGKIIAERAGDRITVVVTAPSTGCPEADFVLYTLQIMGVDRNKVYHVQFRDEGHLLRDESEQQVFVP